LNCVAINTLTNATQLSPTIGRRSSAILNISELADATDPVEQRTANQREAFSRVFVYLLLPQSVRVSVLSIVELSELFYFILPMLHEVWPTNSPVNKEPTFPVSLLVVGLC